MEGKKTPVANMSLGFRDRDKETLSQSHTVPRAPYGLTAVNPG